jgi:hypothetical protein
MAFRFKKRMGGGPVERGTLAYLASGTMTHHETIADLFLKLKALIFPAQNKKACNMTLQAFVFTTNPGGKCKFRTCDPCSVNAVLYP